MAETPDADQQPEEQPGHGSEQVLHILQMIRQERRSFPSGAYDAELASIVSFAGNDLSFALKNNHSPYIQLLHTLLSMTLAEQQRRLIDKSLKQSEALAQSSQEMAEHSKNMAVESAKSAKLATWLVVLGILASLVIGTFALVSSNHWEVRQLSILKSIEQRIPATQPAKDGL